jgi:hypothetical protein
MTLVVAARHPLQGAFGLSRRVARRWGRPACLSGLATAGGLATVVLAIAGCGGQAPVALPQKSATGPAGSPVVAATNPPMTTSQRVVAAYTGYWQALGQALDTRNAAGARAVLAQYTTAASIPALISGFKTDWAHGEIQYGSPVPHILSVRVTGDHATVHDCADFSNAGVQSASTGQVIGGLGSPRVNMISTLVRTHGRWLVSNQVPVVSTCSP